MIKLYGTKISPPCNKVEMCLNALGMEYEFISLDLFKGANRTAEYLAINPFGKVPAIEDGTLKLSESNAIMKYLSKKAKSDLYPDDLVKQTEIDRWCDFVSQHINIQGYLPIAFNKFVAKKIGFEPNSNEIKKGEELLKKLLPLIEEQLNKTKYLAGDKLTIADICLLASVDPSELIELDLKPYPKLSAWRKDLQSQDFYQKTHKFYGESMMAKK